jgi:hypothetical protein
MQDVAEAVLPRGFSSFRGPVILELKRRAQLRILRLHARVIAYRFRNHRLPSALADAAPASEAFDTLSGEPFVYVRNAAGGYRIYSKGRSETGTIELHFEDKSAGPPAKP